MDAFTALMSTHHRYCDDAFVQVEQAAEKGDWPQCLTLTREFINTMDAHFAAEENILFPAFENATGNTMGPTHVMRMEHAQMRELFEQMLNAAETANKKTFQGVTETLLILMEQHNMKEENILYPMCDQHLHSAELIQKIQTELNPL